ncbi:hypothetical protein [Sorangium sp. So ce693]|uniref:hypothetical protein n=1 Tax=Sorangium sp. So ce693 TaxID=3133318 RepID=UPI003F5F27FD
MAKQHGEAAGVPRAIQSEGEDEAKAYAVGEVAPKPLHPTVEMERVHIEDPRRVPPPREGARRGGGARNPEQRAPLADAGAPSVSMPEGLAVTKRQPIVIDSEILAEWHGGRGGGGEERGSEGAGGEAAAEGDEATGSAGARRTAPRLAEVAAARRTERRAGRQRAAWVLAMGVLLAIGVTVLRSVWGAGGGAGEEARGAGEAVKRDAKGAVEEKVGAPDEEKAGAPGAAMARAPAVSESEGPIAAPGGATASVRTTSPVEGSSGAATSSQQDRSGGPAASAASQGAAPRARAVNSATPARQAPSAPAGAAPVKERQEVPRPPSPYDTPNFD